MKGNPKTKKQPVKKSTAGKKKAHSAEKKSLLNELHSLAEDINEEGLRFLVNQSRVLLHNMEVEMLRAGIEKITAKRKKTPEAPEADKLTMEIVEADDNSSFIFVINKERKFFTLQEMRKIVKLCHSSNDEKDASQRLYTWLAKNRKDALVDIGIRNQNDPALKTIYNFIINKYIVKE